MERRQLLEPLILSVVLAIFSRTRTWDGTRVRHRRKCGWECEDLQWPQPLLQRTAGLALKSWYRPGLGTRREPVVVFRAPEPTPGAQYQRSLRGLQGRAWGGGARQAGQQMSLGPTRASLRFSLRNNGISKKKGFYHSRNKSGLTQRGKQRRGRTCGLPPAAWVRGGSAAPLHVCTLGSP